MDVARAVERHRLLAANRPLAVLYALDAATGATVWTASPNLSIIIASPTVADGVVYLAYNDHSIVALDAASSRVLTDEVSGGRFRPDLYFRINVLPIRVPALRERAADMPALVAHLLGVLGAGEVEVAADVMSFLQAYSWPGNIRELSHALERALMLSGRARLERTHFAWLERVEPARASDRADLEQVLREHGGNVEDAARALGLSRATLYRRLRMARDRPR